MREEGCHPVESFPVPRLLSVFIQDVSKLVHFSLSLHGIVSMRTQGSV